MSVEPLRGVTFHDQLGWGVKNACILGGGGIVRRVEVGAIAEGDL